MDKTSCAIMFVDISGSTQLYEQLGDEVAKHAIDKCLAQLSDIVVAQGGKVIKSIGDELMCRFDNADAAIAAAINSQLDVSSMTFTELARLAIRAAVHFGEVIEDDEDIFGDAVNVAARMTGISRAGQIITTEDTVAALKNDLGTQIRQIDLASVKGKQEQIAVFEVLWEGQEPITKISTDLLSRFEAEAGRLKLTFDGKSIEVDHKNRSIKIGRSADCDLVVETSLASREHAFIEMRRGKFVITDQGTNGTYVGTNSGQDVYLRREEFILHGAGRFSLGKPLEECDDSELVIYEC